MNSQHRISLPFFLFGLVLLFAALACSNEQELEVVEVDMGYEYFPLGVGRSWTYLVDSVVFVPTVGGVAQDSSRTLVREILVDTSRSLTGELLFRGERYERKSDTLPWQFRKVFTLSRTERQAIRQEDNVRVVVLSFPNSINADWFPYAYFDSNFGKSTPFPVAGESVAIYHDWEMAVLEQNDTFALSDSLLSEVLIVENVTFPEQNKSREVTERYAPDIGLVDRQWRILDLLECWECCDLDGDFEASLQEENDLCDSLTPIGRATRGFILHQRLIDYE
jgi:hypothetical protein